MEAGGHQGPSKRQGKGWAAGEEGLKEFLGRDHLDVEADRGF